MSGRSPRQDRHQLNGRGYNLDSSGKVKRDVEVFGKMIEGAQGGTPEFLIDAAGNSRRDRTYSSVTAAGYDRLCIRSGVKPGTSKFIAIVRVFYLCL